MSMGKNGEGVGTAGKLTTVEGQPSWRLANEQVELFVTQLGGHLAPAHFRLGARQTVQPFAIAPWAREKTEASIPPILKVLRGDFFCMPFGASHEKWRGETFPPHGETANRPWRFVDESRFGKVNSLLLSLETDRFPGRVDKLILLRNGDSAIYCRHVVFGLKGPMSFGHHPCLQFPAERGSGLISTSGFSFGQVCPEPFEDPAKGGYSSLQRGALFRRLDRVPLAGEGTADLTRYPAREGYEDLVFLATKPLPNLAWTAVVYPKLGYVWMSIKNPAVLTGTVLWHSNGGRHYPPWNGRHRAVLGVEDVTSYFHLGLPASARKNALNAKGVRTVAQLKPAKPLAVNYIMAVGGIPRGFDHVRRVRFTEDRALLTSASGKKTEIHVRGGFVLGGAL